MIRSFKSTILAALMFFLGFRVGDQLKPVIFVMFNPAIIQGTYIRSINVPSLGNEFVEKTLDKFNKMGYSKIIHKKGWRPIDIIEVEELPGAAIGIARVEVLSCRIYLKTSSFQSDTMAEQVIQHELVHCHGYEHTSDPTDLMFASYNDTSEDNKRKYAEDIHKRSKFW